MKRTKKFKLLLLVTMIAGLFCSALFSVSAETGGTAPTEDLLITCQGLENGGVTNPSTSNPNGATGVDRFINVKDYDTSNFGIQTDGWFGVNYAVVLSFKTPIEAKWYEKIQFTLRSNLEGELEFYNSTTTNLVTANAKGIMSAVQYSKNTILLNANDFAAEDGFIHDITIKCASWTDNKGGVVYFGEIKFMLAESAPTEDVVLDCNNTDVMGQQSVDGTTALNYYTKDDGTWGVFTGSGGKYMYTEAVGSDGWMKIQLAKPLKAEYFDFVKIRLLIGNELPDNTTDAKIAIYSLSDTEMINPLAEEGTTAKQNKLVEITIAANSLADADGYIYGFSVKRTEGNPGQHFFDKITFIVPETFDISMEYGAYIRYGKTDAGSGLRFAMQVGAEDYAALNERGATFGMIIMPYDYITNNADALDHLFDGTIFHISAGDAPDGLQKVINLEFGALKAEGDKYVGYGTLSAIKTENLDKRFIGIGYVKYSVDGVEKYVITNFAENNIENSVRSVYQVAQSIVADVNVDDQELKNWLTENYITPVTIA